MAPEPRAAKKAAPAKKAVAKKAVAKKAVAKKAAAKSVAPLVVPPPEPPPALERDDHAVVTLADPQPQRRWTVALRLILMAPHFVWAWLLGIAAGIITFVAWFAALFTGRLPEGLADFLARYTRYTARLGGYGLLLSDEYPPFSLQAEEHAIDVQVSPGKLNRAAVLFRLILLVPAWVLSWFVTAGAFAVSVVGWTATLVVGRLPTPLFEANAAVLSYDTRVNAYYSMLTAEYPARLFVDKSKPGRRVVILYIALGVLVGISGVAGAISAIAGQSALNDLRDDHNALIIDLGQFNASARRCAIASDIDCLHHADFKLAAAFDRFAASVSKISFRTHRDPSHLVQDARDASAALKAMGSSADLASYSAAANHFTQIAHRFDTDYRALDYGAG